MFTAASLLSGATVSQGMLVAARFAQGIDGATAGAVVLGISMIMFPEPHARAKALGVFGFVLPRRHGRRPRSLTPRDGRPARVADRP